MYTYDVVNGVVKKVSLLKNISKAERLSLESYVLANFDFSNIPNSKMKKMQAIAKNSDEIKVISLENSAYVTLSKYCLSNENINITDTLKSSTNWMNSINNYINAILDGLKVVDKTYSTVSSNIILNNFISNTNKLDIVLRSAIETQTPKENSLQTGYIASNELINALLIIDKLLQLKDASITFKDYVSRVVGLCDKVDKAFVDNDVNIDLTVASKDLITLYESVSSIVSDNKNPILNYTAESFIHDYNILMNTVDYSTKTNIKKLVDFIQNTTKRINRLKNSYTGNEYNLVVATQTALNLITYVCYYYEMHLKLNAYMKSLSDSLMYVNI